MATTAPVWPRRSRGDSSTGTVEPAAHEGTTTGRMDPGLCRRSEGGLTWPSTVRLVRFRLSICVRPHRSFWRSPRGRVWRRSEARLLAAPHGSRDMWLERPLGRVIGSWSVTVSTSSSEIEPEQERSIACVGSEPTMAAAADVGRGEPALSGAGVGSSPPRRLPSAPGLPAGM